MSPQLARRKLLVIFDLDGTLLISRDGPTGKRFILRPGARSILRCLSWFGIDTAIWTAGTRDYALAAVDVLYSHTSPLFVMSREDCFNFGTHRQEKPLVHVWAFFPQYDGSNTVIVDDIPDNYRSTPNNGICSPEFTGQEDDDYLRYLVSILVSLKGKRDVRREIAGLRSRQQI